MLQGEHSAILSTFIRLPFVIKIFVLSIFEWPLNRDITGVIDSFQNTYRYIVNKFSGLNLLIQLLLKVVVVFLQKMSCVIFFLLITGELIEAVHELQALEVSKVGIVEAFLLVQIFIVYNGKQSKCKTLIPLYMVNVLKLQTLFTVCSQIKY